VDCALRFTAQKETSDWFERAKKEGDVAESPLKRRKLLCQRREELHKP